jgi:hypothetical protein
MKSSRMFFFSIVCSLLYAAFLAAPQLFAIDDTTTNILKRDETKPTGETGHLQWKDMGEGITYQFQMARDIEFKEILIDRKCEKPEISFPQPDNGGIYYIRMRPVDRDGHEYNFLPVQIYEVNPRLEPPLITAPREITELRNIFDIDVMWHGVPRAAGYHVLLARDRKFKYVIFENAKVPGTSIRISNLDYGTYFLKISTISKDGVEGPFSNTRSFIIVPHTASEPAVK